MNILLPLIACFNAKPELNKALLWDFGTKSYDVEKHKVLIIQRVVEYGSLSDWHFIYTQYGEACIIDVVKQMPSLSNKSRNFVCKLFDLSNNDLKCCTNTPWRVQHWS